MLLWVRIKQLLKVVTKIRNDTSSSEAVVATTEAVVATTEVMYGVTVTTYQSVFIKHLKEQPVILRTHLRWEPERGGWGWQGLVTECFYV